VDRDVARDRRAAGRERLEDDDRVLPGQLRATDVGVDVDPAQAHLRGLAEHVDGEVGGGVPFVGVRGELFVGEVLGRLLEG